jgi:hypothetical protein
MIDADDAGRAPDAAGAATSRAFISEGLGLLGLRASEPELAVIDAVDSIYRPLLDALIRADFDGVEPEPGEDLSRGPHALARR